MKYLIFSLILLIVNNYVYTAPTVSLEQQQQSPTEPESKPQPDTRVESTSERQQQTESVAEGLIEKNNEQDASLAAIQIPVDNANKLLYDLDAQVRQMFDESTMRMKEEKSEQDDGSDQMNEHIQTYSAANRELDIFPRQTDSSQQQASLTMQLENLEKRLLSTINELQSRRRYLSSTMLRRMYNSVHRIRVNIGRIQNQFQSVQPSPQSGGLMGGSRPGQSTMMQNLQQRVTDLQKAVNDIINRVTSTFQGPNAQKPIGGHQQMVNFSK